MATELGKAYVQIIPSARGIRGAISEELGGEAQSAGTKLGSNLIGTFKKVLIAAGIGKLIGSAITEGGNLQQSLGGVETLFKENADIVKKYAQDAYKTVGVSANEYMSNVTSFSASLLQSTAGDTKKSAEVAHMAMVDMADNANKMGSDMSSIQTAYQGFAKQNYTMLDNLKLGYGGTKTEMERLLSDATKLSGVKYDISNLSDVYSAIHVIQNELGITGTTSKEASETIQGSFSAMKSAFQNTLGSIAIGENIEQSLTGLAQTVSTFLFKNFIPMLGTIFKSLPNAIFAFFSTAIPLFIEQGKSLIDNISSGIYLGLQSLPESLSNFLSTIQDFLTNQLPELTAQGTSIINFVIDGITQAIPLLYNIAGVVINNYVGFMMKNLPTVIQAGIDLLFSLIDGIIKNLPQIGKASVQVVSSIIGTIGGKLPDFIKSGFDIIKSLITGIGSRLPDLIIAVGKIMIEVIKQLIIHLPDILKFGANLIKNIIAGILSLVGTLIATIADVIVKLLGKILGFLGQFLNSGVQIIQNIATGIKNTTGNIVSTIGEVIQSALNKALSFLSKMLDAGIKLVQNIAEGIKNTASKIVNAIGDVIQSGKDKIDSWFDNFKNAGANIVNMIAEGIKGAIGKVTTAITDVVQSIRNRLPFSPAKEGPLKDLHKLDFTIIANGIYNAQKPVLKASNELMQGIKDVFEPTNDILGFGNINGNIIGKSFDVGRNQFVNSEKTNELRTNSNGDYAEHINQILIAINNLSNEIKNQPYKQRELERKGAF